MGFKKGNTFGTNRKGCKFTVEHREKISKALTGVPKSTEHKERVSKAKLGTKASVETKLKMSLMRRLEKNASWKGGISKGIYPEEYNDSLREEIRKRDKYTCQECTLHQEDLKGKFKLLDIHHINYNKYDLDFINLITLCHSCHMKTNKGKRFFWMAHFKEIVGKNNM